MRISDCSSDVCSSDLLGFIEKPVLRAEPHRAHVALYPRGVFEEEGKSRSFLQILPDRNRSVSSHDDRSEEHTSELQSLMRSSYAVFCLNKTKKIHIMTTHKRITLQ